MVTVLCLILMYAGFGGVLYGLYVMNDSYTQLVGVFTAGLFRPGALWVIGGVVAIVLATVFILVREFRGKGKKR